MATPRLTRAISDTISANLPVRRVSASHVQARGDRVGWYSLSGWHRPGRSSSGSERTRVMTDQEWTQELLGILEGTAWQVEVAKVAQDKTTTYAEVRHKRSGEEKTCTPHPRSLRDA